MDLTILADIIKSISRKEREELDVKLQLIAWQTALLMNSTGNFKKKVKPEDLYKSLDKTVKEEESQEFNPELKHILQEELLSSFENSDVVVV